MSICFDEFDFGGFKSKLRELNKEQIINWRIKEIRGDVYFYLMWEE